MSAPAAIKGTFSDFKLIKTRKLAQVIIEIPIEQADAALTALGGLPRSDTERWVAIALLDMRKFDAQGNLPTDDNGELPKPRRPFCELPMPQQAGILSNDLKFQLWLSKKDVGRECESAAEAIRVWCGVASRSDIRPGTKTGERWLALLNEFEGVR